MKLNLLAVAVITAFAIGSANAALPDSWVVGAGGGWAHGFDHSFPSEYDGDDIDYKDNGYGLKLYGEYNFFDWLGVGIGYNYLNGQKLKQTDSEGTDEGKMHSNIFETYAKFAYTFDNYGSDVFFKIGPTWSKTSVNDMGKSRLGGVFGLGLQYAVTENLGFRVGYDYFLGAGKINFDSNERLDEGLLYLGFQYTFGGTKAAPAPVPQKVKTSKVHSLDAGILFPFDSSKISDEGQSAVANVVQSANQYENPEFEVYGYTDRIGSDSYNNTLSQKRADAVTAELQNNGVTAKVSEGKGKANPVTGDKCDSVKGRSAVIDCLAPDRRVEVVVTGLETK